MDDYTFTKNSNYKLTLEKEVDKLVEDTVMFTVPKKNKMVEDLCDAYIICTGNVPDNKQLERMANWLLKDDLTDRHPDKMTRNDYPILSEGQAKLRNKRERVIADMGKFSNDKKQRLNGKKKPYVRSEG